MRRPASKSTVSVATEFEPLIHLLLEQRPLRYQLIFPSYQLDCPHSNTLVTLRAAQRRATVQFAEFHSQSLLAELQTCDPR